VGFLFSGALLNSFYMPGQEKLPFFGRPPAGRAFHFKSSVRISPAGFPLQSLTLPLSGRHPVASEDIPF